MELLLYKYMLRGFDSGFEIPTHDWLNFATTKIDYRVICNNRQFPVGRLRITIEHRIQCFQDQHPNILQDYLYYDLLIYYDSCFKRHVDD